MSFLVVCSGLGMRETIRNILTDLRFEAGFFCETAQQALGILKGQRSKPRVVLCQARTVGMSAVELHDAMTADGINIPFVMLSDRCADDSPSAEQRGIGIVGTDPIVMLTFKQVGAVAMARPGMAVAPPQPERVA